MENLIEKVNASNFCGENEIAIKRVGQIGWKLQQPEQLLDQLECVKRKFEDCRNLIWANHPKYVFSEFKENGEVKELEKTIKELDEYIQAIKLLRNHTELSHIITESLYNYGYPDEDFEVESA